MTIIRVVVFTLICRMIYPHAVMTVDSYLHSVEHSASLSSVENVRRRMRNLSEISIEEFRIGAPLTNAQSSTLAKSNK